MNTYIRNNTFIKIDINYFNQVVKTNPLAVSKV